MKKKVAVLVILVMVLVVFQAWCAESQFVDQKIDISKMTCKEMMSGNDADREVTTAFFHGFFAGKKNAPIVDVASTSDLSDKVRDYCLSNPTSTVMDAFTKAGK